MFFNNGSRYDWRDNHPQVLFKSLFFAVWLSGVVVWIVSIWFQLGFVYVACPTFLILFLLIYSAYGRRRHQTICMFFVDMSVAAELVEDILLAKGAPYIDNGRCFALDDVMIELRRFGPGRNGISGTTVALGPTISDNMLLIESLQKKLDDAFLGFYRLQNNNDFA